MTGSESAVPLQRIIAKQRITNQAEVGSFICGDCAVTPEATESEPSASRTGEAFEDSGESTQRERQRFCSLMSWKSCTAWALKWIASYVVQ